MEYFRCVMIFVATLLAVLIIAEAGVIPDRNSNCRILINDTSKNPWKSVECTKNFEKSEDLSQRLAEVPTSEPSMSNQQNHLLKWFLSLLEGMEESENIIFIMDGGGARFITQPSPGFKGRPEDEVRQLEFYNVDGSFGWDWSQIPIMKNLYTLIVDNSKLLKVLPDMNEFAPILSYIEWSLSSLESIHPRAFNMLVNLRICNLSRNSIKEVKRSMFPVPADKLRAVDLSYNKLSQLPGDIFSNMPQIREIKLDGNVLQNIGPMMKVWPQLTEVWLQKNNLQCKALCWTVEQSNIPVFYSSTKCISDDKVSQKTFLTEFAPVSCIQT